MDIFADVLRHNHTLLRAAVSRAASQLGVFRMLGEADGEQPHDVAGIAAKLGLPQQRLRQLLDVLVAEGFLSRTVGSGGEQLRLVSVPERTDVSASDWDRIAEVISSDQPLALRDMWLENHLEYVASKGRYVAPILWRAIDPKPGARLLDVGGGLGAYSLAFLNHHPDNRATVVDLPETLRLLEKTATAASLRFETKCGDALEQLPGSGYDIVLLANVLHLYGVRDCREIVRRAADAVATDGSAVIKDVFVSLDRAGPTAGLYFALNMALYTEAGDVHPAPAIVSWMRDAGLTDVHSLDIPGLDGSTVVVGRRQQS